MVAVHTRMQGAVTGDADIVAGRTLFGRPGDRWQAGAQSGAHDLSNKRPHKSVDTYAV